MILSGDVDHPVNPLAKHGVYVEGNMANILETILIDISRTPDVMENMFINADRSPKEICTYTALFKELCDVFAWSYKEMPDIGPHIIKHKIKTYENEKLV